ncbi:triphosphoribosyl-dephospho-CoA synthase, partial [Pseudomonas aeruginosa]|nr:triphosphoribosyl-dephospho-CoA synthase [Pseudomonas aeruginosa]
MDLPPDSRTALRDWLTEQLADLGECLADLAVDALIDEAELSPKPALVDRRGNGAHADLHLGLMQ